MTISYLLQAFSGAIFFVQSCSSWQDCNWHLCLERSVVSLRWLSLLLSDVITYAIYCHRPYLFLSIAMTVIVSRMQARSCRGAINVIQRREWCADSNSIRAILQRGAKWLQSLHLACMSCLKAPANRMPAWRPYTLFTRRLVIAASYRIKTYVASSFSGISLADGCY